MNSVLLPLCLLLTNYSTNIDKSYIIIYIKSYHQNAVSAEPFYWKSVNNMDPDRPRLMQHHRGGRNEMK